MAPQEKMHDAIKMFAARDVGTVVVVEDGAPVGVLTERDVVKALAKGADALDWPLRDVMSSPLVTVSPNTKLPMAVRLMVEKRIRRLPVTSRGNLVGIITARDILRWILGEVAPRYRAKELTTEELALVLSGWE